MRSLSRALSCTQCWQKDHLWFVLRCWPLHRRGSPARALLPSVVRRRHERCNYDGGDHKVNSLVYVWHRTPKRVTEQDHAPHPKETSAYIVHKINGITHAGGAGDRRAERPYNRDEPRQDDRLPAVVLVELMSALE